MPPFAFTIKLAQRAAPKAVTKPAPKPEKKRTVEKWSAEKIAEEKRAVERRAADKKKAEAEEKRRNAVRLAERAEEKRAEEKRAAEDLFEDFDFDIDYCPCASGLYFIGCCLDKPSK